MGLRGSSGEIEAHSSGFALAPDDLIPSPTPTTGIRIVKLGSCVDD